MPDRSRAWARLLGAWLAVAAAPALATTTPVLITFDANAQSNFGNGVFDSGYRFAGVAGTVALLGTENTQGAFNGTPSLVAWRDPMTMQRRDGQAFTLQALDIGLYGIGASSPLPPDGPATVTAKMVLAGGGEATQAVEVGPAYQRWSFGVDVVAVHFEQPFDVHLRFDNIAVLSPVPEPASWAMLLAGAAALAARRGRRGRA